MSLIQSDCWVPLLIASAFLCLAHSILVSAHEFLSPKLRQLLDHPALLWSMLVSIVMLFTSLFFIILRSVLGV